MKLFAFFLPQFHEIPENDAWWGKGFTEWTNVRRAKPLFDGHIQPKEPLDDNYYNLLDLHTMEWQTRLMHEYAVDGLIYYHYYFKGKKLLEKPAENLLAHPEINQKFFFCWANHTWLRSWEGKKDVLLEQTYGEQEDWEKHFQYLLPFFLDSRYEKKNNMPLFMTFNRFHRRREMYRYFDRRCQECGFNGLYLIETFQGTDRLRGFLRFLSRTSITTKRIFIRQPSEARQYCDRHGKYDIRSGVRIYDGNDLYDHMICHSYHGKKFINGSFLEWDNTPRHKKQGYVITPPDKEHFMTLMVQLKKNEYVFLNAWNEWAEGMIMEPTKGKGYQYLEWIKEFRENEQK